MCCVLRKSKEEKIEDLTIPSFKKLEEPKNDAMKTITIPLWTFGGILLGCVAIVAIFVLGVQDGNECLSKPLNYGAEKALQSTGGQIFCSCQFSNPSYAPLFFNEETMSTKQIFGGAT